jgi:hypothetical protein
LDEFRRVVFPSILGNQDGEVSTHSSGILVRSSGDFVRKSNDVRFAISILAWIIDFGHQLGVGVQRLAVVQQNADTAHDGDNTG